MYISDPLSTNLLGRLELTFVPAIFLTSFSLHSPGFTSIHSALASILLVGQADNCRLNISSASEATIPAAARATGPINRPLAVIRATQRPHHTPLLWGPP